MSLFPAYSSLSDKRQGESLPAGNGNWLENSSFPVPVCKEDKNEATSSTEKNNLEGSLKSKRKRKKKKSKKKTPITKVIAQEKNCSTKENDTFVIDRKGEPYFSKEKTVPKTLRPKYCALLPGLSFMFSLKHKKRKRRYFRDQDVGTRYDEVTLQDETETIQKRESFNKKLTDNPHDIATWIEFVKFQDEFYQYQHITYRSTAERERAAAQHKLSILDKAVTQNPDNDELQALWLKIGSNVLPSEEMSKRIDSILAESGGTMTLWLGLMTTTQYSLARCTVPSVSLLYEKLLLNFQNVNKFDCITRDRNVLELLFHYGRFLDNCSQWETLWTIIKVIIQFNTTIELNFDIEVDEKVKKLEDEVIKQEKQAVWQLWSQLECIREGLHFLPSSNSIDYPQRCVLPENVVNFTWHFHPDLHFQLIVSFVILLKVPLLLSSHTILKKIVPNCLPWVFNSPEFILSSVLSSPTLNFKFTYFKPLIELSKGPQYLRKINGQQEFLDLISFTFKACFKALKGRHKTALGVWWLRFERWIHLLSKLNLVSLPDGRKTAKNFFKDFLENEENRENLLYYLEYCLLQYNQGNCATCIKILKTLVSSKPSVLDLDDGEEKSALIAVYRTYCEILIGTNQRNEALNVLINLGKGAPVDASVNIHTLAQAEKTFKHSSIQLIEELQQETDIPLENLLLPSYIVDWISCYLWFIALTKTSKHLKSTFTEFFTCLKDKNGIFVEHIRECLWETVLSIIWTFEKSNFFYVKNILQECHLMYSQNLKIMTYLAQNCINNSILWISMKKTFLSPPSTISCIFLICVALERFYKDKEVYQNRMKNLLQDLALKEGKLSSIIHSLRLRFLYEYENGQLEVAQLQAIDSCPWNKSVYTESILLLPAKLMQLTDILIEKEIKIHITPDEIQEMRD